MRLKTQSAQATVPIEAFAVLDSTNAEARRRAEAGDTGPSWITAARQSAGRGRLGRGWQTPTGNLAATLLYTTGEPAARAAQVSFVAGLAVYDLIARYVPAERIGLKWPNDALIEGEKAAGVLIESGAAAAGGLWVAVGIGVNLAVAPEIADRPTTCLARHIDGPPPEPSAALAILADAYALWSGRRARDGFAAIAEAWTHRARGIGERCLARLPAETVEGVAVGLDSDGALLLRTAAGEVRRITAGDVFFG